MNRGIDYGMGATNIDRKTGIRYGVISQHAVLQAWADSSEAQYGEPSCPECGNPAKQAKYRTRSSNPPGKWVSTAWYGMPKYADGKGRWCTVCKVGVDSEDAYPGEPLSFTYEQNGYTCESDSTGDIFITRSPYYTRAALCSPCAPGACYLTNPTDEGERAYCFGHDWFEDGKAPYPVYRVSDDMLVDPGNES